jgi:hypothetical protein
LVAVLLHLLLSLSLSLVLVLLLPMILLVLVTGRHLLHVIVEKLIFLTLHRRPVI